eukprot:766111-Hanusia_phi.AAC.2
MKAPRRRVERAPSKEEGARRGPGENGVWGRKKWKGTRGAELGRGVMTRQARDGDVGVTNRAGAGAGGVGLTLRLERRVSSLDAAETKKQLDFNDMMGGELGGRVGQGSEQGLGSGAEAAGAGGGAGWSEAS